MNVSARGGMFSSQPVKVDLQAMALGLRAVGGDGLLVGGARGGVGDEGRVGARAEHDAAGHGGRRYEALQGLVGIERRVEAAIEDPEQAQPRERALARTSS